MSLLDGGIRELFGSVFGEIYEDATLITSARTEDEYGSITEVKTEVDVKAHRPTLTDAYRAAAGFSDDEIDIIILSAGLTKTPSANDYVEYQDKTYAIVHAKEDGAHSHWRCRAKPWLNAAGSSTGVT